MNYQDIESFVHRWRNLTLIEQMANIGSEVERAIDWRNKNNFKYCQLAFERALELLNLTISSQTKFSRLKELTRLKELLIDYFAFDNNYQSSENQWRKYFSPFFYAARCAKKSTNHI